MKSVGLKIYFSSPMFMHMISKTLQISPKSFLNGKTRNSIVDKKTIIFQSSFVYL